MGLGRQPHGALDVFAELRRRDEVDRKAGSGRRLGFALDHTNACISRGARERGCCGEITVDAEFADQLPNPVEGHMLPDAYAAATSVPLPLINSA
jgi:hypothetical protein